MALVIVAVAGGLSGSSGSKQARPSRKWRCCVPQPLPPETLDRTIRVSGIVTAERFAALMAPRLRGSRNASGGLWQPAARNRLALARPPRVRRLPQRVPPRRQRPPPLPLVPPPRRSGRNSSTASTNTALNAQSAAAGTPGAPASSLGAIRGTTNRFGDRAAAQSSSNKSAASGSSQSSAAPRWDRTDWDRLQPGC